MTPFSGEVVLHGWIENALNMGHPYCYRSMVQGFHLAVYCLRFSQRLFYGELELHWGSFLLISYQELVSTKQQAMLLRLLFKYVVDKLCHLCIKQYLVKNNLLEKLHLVYFFTLSMFLFVYMHLEHTWLLSCMYKDHKMPQHSTFLKHQFLCTPWVVESFIILPLVEQFTIISICGHISQVPCQHFYLAIT